MIFIFLFSSFFFFSFIFTLKLKKRSDDIVQRFSFLGFDEIGLNECGKYERITKINFLNGTTHVRKLRLLNFTGE